MKTNKCIWINLGGYQPYFKKSCNGQTVGEIRYSKCPSCRKEIEVQSGDK